MIHKDYTNIILFFAGYLTYNYLIPVSPYSPFIFLIPLFLSKSLLSRSRFTIAILLLLSVTDIPLEGFTETPWILRKIVGVIAFALLISTAIGKKKLKLVLFFTIFWVITTIYNSLFGASVWDVFIRDVFILITIIFVNVKYINKTYLFYFSLGALLGSFTFIIFDDTLVFTQYHSYNSTKSFLVYPFFYLLINKSNRLIKIFMFFLVAFVLIHFQTRMLFLSFLIVCIILVLKNIKYFLIPFLIYCLIAPFFINLTGTISTNVFSAKSVASLSTIYTNGGLVDLQKIDRVRYNEHFLFFNRTPLEILIGSGFGSALVDKDDRLGFVRKADTAFSDAELETKVYWNLHDTWIDLGLRFGLFFICMIYIFLFLGLFMNNSEIDISALGLVLFSNMTFSSLGLLICITFLTFLYQKSKRNINNEPITYRYA